MVGCELHSKDFGKGCPMSIPWAQVLCLAQGSIGCERGCPRSAFLMSELIPTKNYKVLVWKKFLGVPPVQE
jgi:hypothetical protein